MEISSSVQQIYCFVELVVVLIVRINNSFKRCIEFFRSDFTKKIDGITKAVYNLRHQLFHRFWLVNTHFDVPFRGILTKSNKNHR